MSTPSQQHVNGPIPANRKLSLAVGRTNPVTESFFDELRQSWVRGLKARKLSPNTIAVYDRAAGELLRHLAEHQPKLEPHELRREHMEKFLIAFGEGRSASTLSLTYRALQQWFSWLVEEGELDEDPTARMHAPQVPEKAVPVLTTDELSRLLATCNGRRMVDRRDMAILRLFIDTGGRLAEIAGLKVTDLDLNEQVCTVMGKGQRERILPFGNRTADALDRYLRIRKHDRNAALPGLWLGEKGKGTLTSNGIYQMLRRRGATAGLPDIHPHQFRHTAAHRWLAEGGQETDLMQIAGWKSRSMLQRYAASAAAERARDAHRRLGLGDRL